MYLFVRTAFSAVRPAREKETERRRDAGAVFGAFSAKRRGKCGRRA